jgi:hypothetical protein
MIGMLIPVLLSFGFGPLSGQETMRLLGADGPAPEHREKLMLFGQFVGDWEFEGVARNADGAHLTDKGEIHFSWVLQGRAVQDLWIERERSDAQPKTYGTTIRMYDPKIDAWRITFIEPGYVAIRSLVGGQVGDEIVLEGSDSDGTPIRWIFSEIKPNAFHWRGERKTGDAWRVYEELDAHRKR